MPSINKTTKSRQTQENRIDSERSTPVPEENVDSIDSFVSTLPSEHQLDVLTIINTGNLSIDTKLHYLEDYLTVGQLKECRKLLQEHCSNFKQFLTKQQLTLIDKMLAKKDFDSIKKTISGNTPALDAFQNYLKYNGHEENGENPADEEKEKEEEQQSKRKDNKCSKSETHKKKNGRGTQPVESSNEDESNEEEEESESDESSEEEELVPKLKKNKNNKKDTKNIPDNMNYQEWLRHCEASAAMGKAPPTPIGIWDMAARSERELNDMKNKADQLEKENGKLKKELQAAEQLRKQERDELNRYNEQKLQEASRNYLEELNQLKDHHARELNAARQQAGQVSANTTLND